jgi:putative redox protein
MKVQVRLEEGMKIVGSNENGKELRFDAHIASGGEESAPVPMEGVLQSLAACTSMDVISILRKKRKQIDNYEVFVDAERAEEHPKVFTQVTLRYELTSPDASEQDFQRSIELSQDKYCPVVAMLRAAGVTVDWSCEVKQP